ncbi:MAG TPA: phosphodiester glycosidase family protein [Cytophagales bacterium]|nr:phosphodiester glycosidase family protein [Cytophagales bacterium]
MNINKHLLLVASLLLFSTSSKQVHQIAWLSLEEGLHYASIPLTSKSVIGDSQVDILKINMDRFQLKLLCAGEKGMPSKAADRWAQDHKLLALVNAGMFELDGTQQTCTGYMKNYGYLNNPKLNPSYKNILVFNAKDASHPAAQIIDITCQSWNTLKLKYQSYAQGIRMINCEGKNTWQKDAKKWSMVLIGENKAKELLFIFVRSPYTVHEFVNHLQGLDLGLTRLMYLEGGPEASFYLNHPKAQVQKMGSYETGFNENDDNKVYWNIPNVIGLVRK